MANSKKIIFLPGLGADQRLFDSLSKKISGHNFIYPPHENDFDLNQYAKRCIDVWNLTPPFIIIGFSFGGIIGKEILKEFNSNEAQLFMISSCRSYKSIDTSFKLLSKVLYFVPNFILRFLLVYIGPFYAKRSDSSLSNNDFKLLRNMAKDVDLDFFRWSVKQSSNWKETEELDLDIFQIHGEFDSVIPIKKGEADYTVPGGHHLICYTHPDEIKKQFNQRYKL